MFSPPAFSASLRKFPTLVVAVGVTLLVTAYCGGSRNPASPTPSGGPRVSTSISPLPVRLQARSGASPSQYQISGDVAFRETAGIGGRITEMTVSVVNSRGDQGTPRKIALDLPLPAGGTATQPISEPVDASAVQGLFQLQLTATVQDQQGKAFAVPAVQLPVAINGAAATNSPFNHVFIVVEENETAENVIGGSSMPYLNSLAAQYAQATEYYANTHPSIGNYFMMTVGETITNVSGFMGTVAEDNIVRQLIAAGRTWKAYAEGLPSVGYTGGDVGLYARRHNPLAAISDVAGNPAQARNLVPFTEFAADLAANTFPNYSFIVPDLCHDGHDCPLRNADAWLQANIAPLISSSQFQQDGLLIVLFDEAAEADRRNGGGRVAWVAVSAKSKRGYRSRTFYQHESTLRLTAEALGLTVFPNRAATAPSMNEFFNP